MNIDPYIRALFGANAIHVPFNCIVQADMQHNTVSAVVVVGGTPQIKDYLFGSKMTHQLILGDAVIRPRLVFESDHLRGVGFAGLARNGMSNVDEWLKNGKLIIPPS